MRVCTHVSACDNTSLSAVQRSAGSQALHNRRPSIVTSWSSSRAKAAKGRSSKKSASALPAQHSYLTHIATPATQAHTPPVEDPARAPCSAKSSCVPSCSSALAFAASTATSVHSVRAYAGKRGQVLALEALTFRLEAAYLSLCARVAVGLLECAAGVRVVGRLRGDDKHNALLLCHSRRAPSSQRGTLRFSSAHSTEGRLPRVVCLVCFAGVHTVYKCIYGAPSSVWRDAPLSTQHECHGTRKLEIYFTPSSRSRC